MDIEKNRSLKIFSFIVLKLFYQIIENERQKSNQFKIFYRNLLFYFWINSYFKRVRENKSIKNISALYLYILFSNIQ